MKEMCRGRARKGKSEEWGWGRRGGSKERVRGEMGMEHKGGEVKR